MKKLRDGLYIGNITDAALVMSAEAPPVSHILSLVGYVVNPLEFKRPSHIADADPEVSGRYSAEKLQKMNVNLQDVESQNLLDKLDGCLEFIEEGRRSGAVMVHCLAGISRSGAVVTAYLMQKEHLSAADALASVQIASPGVCPNSGFMEQLLMFEKMGHKVDRTSPVYKKFKVEVLGNSYAKGEVMESSSYALDPGSAAIILSTSSDDQEVKKKQSTVYRCKKCRRVVAREENVIEHDVGVGEASFKWKKRGGGCYGQDESEQPSCTSVFVEPMQWMTTVEGGVVEGKLQCVKCEARLGNFNWSGMQCSCGAWVTPAFQLHKSRMDAAPL